MDAIAIGLSIEPTSNFRIYGELNYPPRWIKSIRPDMFAPSWVVRDNYSTSIVPDDADYNARIVNVGFEFRHNFFKNLGTTTIGYDLHMYEEGKIQYELEDGATIWFDEDAPWELEHNVRIAQEINDTVSVELTYHNGRSPFNNFYFQHTEIWGIGARFNPKSTVTLFDTE